MSNYVRVLKRLETDAGRVAAAPPRDLPPHAGAQRPQADRPATNADLAPPAPASRPTPRPQLPIASGDLPGVAELFDNIRAMAAGRARRTIVFAGASAAEHVSRLTAALATHAERHGTSVLRAALTTSSGRALLVRHDRPTDVLEIDLNGGTTPAQLDTWLSDTSPKADLVIIEGPALTESIDAALLACACDGLMIVAERQVTPRAALRTAAERARITGCRTLGVVMTGAQERLPGWLRQLLSIIPTSSTREES